jgi:hypothetical protein
VSPRREGCSSDGAYGICRDISVVKTAVASNEVAKLVLKFSPAGWVGCTTNLHAPFSGDHAGWLRYKTPARILIILQRPTYEDGCLKLVMTALS